MMLNFHILGGNKIPYRPTAKTAGLLKYLRPFVTTGY